MQLARTREWRESRGLTQRELAAEAGISEVTVARLETGHSSTPPTARKIATALDVSVADLLERPPVPFADAPPETGHHEMRPGSSDESEEGLAPTIHYVNGAVDQLLEQLVHDGMDKHRALVLVGKRVEERLAEETV